MQAENGGIEVSFEGGRTARCPAQTLVGALADGETAANGLHYIGALVNNEVVSLRYPLDVDCEVRFLTMADQHGWHVYRRSVSFLLAKTAMELFPKAEFAVEHSLGTGYYCSFELNGQKGISPEQLEEMERRMRETVEKRTPIERRRISYTSALKQFEEERQWDKYNLLRFSNPPKVVTYCCEGFMDVAHGPMAPHMGCLGHFRLLPHPPGFILQFPERDNAPNIPPFEAQPYLFNIFKEYKEWGRILNVNTVGRLNEIVTNKGLPEFVRIAEALHEKKIAQIADHIRHHHDRIAWVLIAGPSSSGKTTFAKRLEVQLRVNGLKPVTLSVDNYFVDRTKTPRTADGEFDFENIETIDLPLFHKHLAQLDRGETVDLPTFDFQKGRQEFNGHSMAIRGDEIVILEGIHALNPRLTQVLPGARKFKIYISALTQLNLDNHNRISTTDNRLIRRLVRDHQFRGNTALMTLQMWPNVRHGEKTWIFPFQHEADIAFNSALDYELAVLKHYVEPLLFGIKPSQPQYAEARRLLAFLSSFLGISSEGVPATSILREFVGKSAFHY